MKRLAYFIAGFAISLLGTAHAELYDDIAQQPLFTSGNVKHNILFALDDSGSMDWDILLPTNQGQAYWDDDRESFGDPGSQVSKFLNVSGTAKSFVNHFWSGGASAGVPPVRNYAFVRSSLYNLGYYDHGIDYNPWPSYGGFNYVDATPSAACYDPFLTADESADPISCDSGKSIDLTMSNSNDYEIETGMACDGSCPAGSKQGSGLPGGSTEIWSEDFEGMEGATSGSGWSTSDASAVPRSTNGDRHEVDGGELRLADASNGNATVNGDLVEYVEWLTGSINIAGYTDVAFILEIEAHGYMEGAGEFWEDRIEVDYKIDGGSWARAYGRSDDHDATVIVDGLTGSSLQLRIRAATTGNNGGGTERFEIDNIQVADISTATPGAGCTETCDTGNDEIINYWVATYYAEATSGTFDIDVADVPDVGGGGTPDGSVMEYTQSSQTERTVNVTGLNGDTLTIFVRADTTARPSTEVYYIDNIVVKDDVGAILWSEDFNGLTNGTTSESGKWSSNMASAIANQDTPITEVFDNKFRFADTSNGNPRGGTSYLTEYGEWLSVAIPIGNQSDVQFSLDISTGGSDFESSGTYEDRIEVWYLVESDDADEYCSASGGTYTCDCAEHDANDPIATDLYAAWEGDPTLFKNFTGGLNDADTDGFADFAIGPDGRCLERIEIEPGRATYPSGRTYAEEMQNFANWFQYYRRRTQGMRGGLAKALEGVSGVNIGLFWINDRRSIDFDVNAPSSSTMWDWDQDKARDPSYFLDDIYGHSSSGSTPLRPALQHAGEQYKQTGSTAPIQEICQQNFAILFTDGFHNTNDGVNITANNADGSAGTPYQDSHSDTLADIAMHYYDVDDADNLRPDLDHSAVPVDPACPIDPATASPADCMDDLHMNTYTVGLGATGQSIYNITHDNVVDAYAMPPAWVNPSNNTPEMIDDLYHAAINGRGEIYNADTPTDLANALEGALTDIAGVIGSSSAASFNTGRLEAGAMLYQSLLNSNNWTGTLRAFELDPSNGQLIDSDPPPGEPGRNPDWDAQNELDTRDLAVTPRVILTHDGGDGVAFQWGNLTADQKADLKYGGVADSVGQERLDFIRGDRGNEGSGIFRGRGSRLADIADSQAQYVGQPDDPWPDGGEFPSGNDAYSDFQSSQSTRTKMIYVGGNDGMLHGFRAASQQLDPNAGQEALAYIPASLFSDQSGEGLHYLTETGYNHRFYVNLTPTVTDVYIDPDGWSNRLWRTVLIGGLRNGGRGMFALDVTDPTAFTEANAADLVLWEFDSSDDSDLGYTFSEAVVVKLNNGKWGAIFGNGYNDTGSGTAQLFILFIEEGADGSWDAGDYVKLDTGVGGSSGGPNGLSRPAVADLDGDFVADRVYAGDLEGNLWAFDISDSSDLVWDLAYSDPLLAADTSGRGDTPNSRMHQPITSAPALARNPYNGSAPNLLVIFGTGQYIVAGDNNTACPNGSTTGSCAQSFYIVQDRGDSNLTYADLVRQEVTTVTAQVTDPTNDQATITVDSRTVTSNPVGATDYGCYLDLPAAKERVVSKPVVRGPTVFFNTIIPEQGACTGGGEGWLMTLAYANCGATQDPQFDVNKDDEVDEGDLAGGSIVLIGEKVTAGMPSGVSILSEYRYTTTTNSDEVLVGKIAPLGGGSGRTGRLSWEELRR